MQYLKINFSFASAGFRCLSNDVALKGLFLHNCVVFSLFCVAIVIFEPVFERTYLGQISLLLDVISSRLDIFGLKRN